MRQAAQRKLRILLIALLGCAAIAAAAFHDEVRSAYETWRHGAPGIAHNATAEARSVALEFWPFARAICADPVVTAAELSAQNPVSDYRLWNGGYDLTLRSDLIEIRQRRLYGHRWDQGWMLQSITVGGNLERVEVERLRLGPADGPAPSTHAIYDRDCRLVSASLFEIDTVSEGPWEWPRTCLGPGWVKSDCDAIQEGTGRFVDVSNLSFDEEEMQCFDSTWSHTVCY